MLNNELISTKNEKYIKYVNECNDLMDFMKFNKSKITENRCMTNIDLKSRSDDEKNKIFRKIINKIETLFLLGLCSFNIEMSNILEDNNGNIVIDDIFSHIINENTIKPFDINKFINMLNITELNNNQEKINVEEVIILLLQEQTIIKTKQELDNISTLNKLFKLNANEYYYSKYHYIDNKTSITKSTKPNEQNAIYFDSGIIYY